jgi:hypothetical protein
VILTTLLVAQLRSAGGSPCTAESAPTRRRGPGFSESESGYISLSLRTPKKKNHQLQWQCGCEDTRVHGRATASVRSNAGQWCRCPADAGSSAMAVRSCDRTCNARANRTSRVRRPSDPPRSLTVSGVRLLERIRRDPSGTTLSWRCSLSTTNAMYESLVL